MVPPNDFVGLDDFLDVLGLELVLLFDFFEMPGSIDEEHVIGLLAFLQDKDADRDGGGVEEVGRHTDHCVDVAVLEQLGADAFLRTAPEEHAVQQDDGHHAFVFEVVEAVEQEGEVGGRFGSESVAFEAHVVRQSIIRFPPLAERWIGYAGVEARLLGRVLLAHQVPVVEQCVAVEDLELGILHPMEQHVHAGEVVGGYVLFLPENLSNGAAGLVHLFADVELQRAGAAGHVHDTLESFFRAGSRLLAVQRDNGGEHVGNPLRGVELSRLLAGAGRELADQVFAGVAQRIDVRRELRQTFGNLLDDRAELGVPIGIGFAQLVRAEIDLGEEALEDAVEGFRLDVFEARLQRVEEFRVLGAGHIGDAAPEVFGANDIVHLAAHLLLKLGREVRMARGGSSSAGPLRGGCCSGRNSWWDF